MTKQQTYAQLEEAAKHYASVTDQEAHGIDFIREVFIAGAEWQAEHSPLPDESDILRVGIKEGKRQMMKEAMEGTIWVDYGFPAPSCLQINLGHIKGNEEFHEGDKVRVIIVKE